ncbi:MAG: glutamyl-tRNA reductase [Nitrospirae bacterium]|nr:MAG: glutamyl-tRNA reductase [Nitrospirota bacterium]
MILVVGLNHKTAPVEVRETLAFEGENLKKGLHGLKALPSVEGGVIVSTCNRVEMYCHVKDSEKAKEEIVDFILRFHNLRREDVLPSLYFLEDTEGVRHVFRVASSLDSMVVGEPQILGQVKDAFEYALSEGTTTAVLNKLLKKAISVAKRVRTETRIAENAVSISYAAVELAKKIFEDLTDKAFMLLGAGEMAELAVRHLISNGVREVAVANRTYERAVELAKEFSGRPVRFDMFKDEMVGMDIVICSTGAPSYILHKNEMVEIMKKRKGSPVFIIDISVPRNIDPAINEIDNVYLYDVDDLQEVVDANILQRKAEAEKAETIVVEEVEKFQKWLSSLDAVPTIVALRQKAEEIRDRELERLFNRLQGLDERQKEIIRTSFVQVVNRLIHPPTVALKEDREDRDELIAIIKTLYGLEEQGEKDSNRHTGQ